MLNAIPLFSSLSEKQLASVGAHAAWRVFEKGDVILRQGELADAFFVIASGESIFSLFLCSLPLSTGMQKGSTGT